MMASASITSTDAEKIVRNFIIFRHLREGNFQVCCSCNKPSSGAHHCKKALNHATRSKFVLCLLAEKKATEPKLCAASAGLMAMMNQEFESSEKCW
jgi:hypothetical protein